MEPKRIKLDREKSPFPINRLFDEILEEVFTHLQPKDQLTCRQVCHLWNELLCRDGRLLKKSVGIHLHIDSTIQIDAEHPLVAILKENPALKVRKLTIDAELFSTDHGMVPKLQELEQYFVQFEKTNDSITEVIVIFTPYQNLAMFEIIFTLLNILKHVKILRLRISDMEAGLQSNLIPFPQKWNESKWESVEEVYFSFNEWNSHVYQNYLNFCSKFPNLRVISGIDNFNQAFYQKFQKQIKYIFVSYQHLTQIIESNLQIQLKSIYIFGDDYPNNTENIWNFINNNQRSLEKVSLDIDNPFHFEDPEGIFGTARGPIPHRNYDKVKWLKFHLPLRNEQSHQLHQDLKLFKNVVKLQMYLTIFEDCFFGHEALSLPNLESVEFIVRRNDLIKINCSECFNALIESFRQIKEFHLCLPVSIDDVKFIGQTLTNLENLKIVKFGVENENNFYDKWPLMENVKDIVIPFKTDLNEANVVEKFCDACPNLKVLRIMELDTLNEKIGQVFLDKLKQLEMIKLDNDTYMVQVEGDQRNSTDIIAFFFEFH
uniref:CSON003185 protein n=1 Tax=Culicoides sonorensis TaxID=179676 RepID=A0A336LSX8_CULSO